MTIRPCLDPHLLEDIAAMNRRFIAVLVDAATARRVQAEPELVGRLVRRLDAGDRRWPACPFLLYRPLRHERAPADVCLDRDDPAVVALVTLTLGFLWQLARDNPPAAQAVSGTDAAWCRALAKLSIAHLSLLSAELTLRPRLIDVPGFWQDLTRRRGISALQRASLAAAGMQLILARGRRARAAGALDLVRQRADALPPRGRR